MNLNVLTVSTQDAASIRYLINKIDGQNVINIFSPNISPKNLQIYKYDLINNQTFTFTDQSKTVLFRLYLAMPQEIYQVDFPNNIEWENIEDQVLEESNTLYMFVFEWSTELNKWLGNLMWKSAYTNSSNNGYTNGVSPQSSNSSISSESSISSDISESSNSSNNSNSSDDSESSISSNSSKSSESSQSSESSISINSSISNNSSHSNNSTNSFNSSDSSESISSVEGSNYYWLSNGDSLTYSLTTTQYDRNGIQTDYGSCTVTIPSLTITSYNQTASNTGTAILNNLSATGGINLSRNSLTSSIYNPNNYQITDAGEASFEMWVNYSQPPNEYAGLTPTISTSQNNIKLKCRTFNNVNQIQIPKSLQLQVSLDNPMLPDSEPSRQIIYFELISTSSSWVAYSNYSGYNPPYQE